jgi:hypothetical protein
MLFLNRKSFNTIKDMLKVKKRLERSRKAAQRKREELAEMLEAA